METEILRPRALRAGDTVQIVAPASHFERDRFEKGVSLLEQQLGVKVKWRDDIFDQEMFLAGSDTRRASELMEAFADPSVAGIFCARGGYGSMRLLPLLDAKVIRKNPKVFVGYSDITCLHLWMRRTTGLVTLHGPLTTGALATGMSSEDWESLVSATTIGRELRLTGKALVGGYAEGALLGGNLSVLASLCATPAEPDLTGSILFLEDIGEKPYRLDRMLTQLKLARLFDGVSGVVLGDFTDCENPAAPGITSLNVLKAFFESLGVPTIHGAPIGHGKFNRTLPMGAWAKLDADQGTLHVPEAWLAP